MNPLSSIFSIPLAALILLIYPLVGHSEMLGVTNPSRSLSEEVNNRLVSGLANEKSKYLNNNHQLVIKVGKFECPIKNTKTNYCGLLPSHFILLVFVVC